jgi:putative zinc finger/helix-turn-helix YgiT family protein
MFNYTCEECGKGTVRETIFRDYQTKIKGYSFVVDEAKIGVCDKCQAKHFNSTETKRWEELYSQLLLNKNMYLSPSDILEVRESLGLSVEGLAYLIGCTRQSIYNWEKLDREKPQSRMADLLIKLVRDSARFGEINVIDFLVEGAQQLGIGLKIVGQDFSSNVIRLTPKSVLEEYLKHSNVETKLAAADRVKKIIVAESSKKDVIGLLRYDFEKADLLLKILKDTIGLRVVDVTVITSQGQECSRQAVEVKNNEILLLAETDSDGRDIKEIILKPTEVNLAGLQT